METSDFTGLKSLFLRGVSVNTQICEKSILWWAVEKQDSSLVLFLLESGALTCSVTAPDCSVLLKALEKTKKIPDDSSEAFAIVKMLLASGADANATGCCGDSAALMALNDRNMALFRLLIEHGADVNSFDGVESLLAAAVRMQLPDFAGFLLECGAKITPDSDNRPLLHAAILVNNPEIVKILLEHGADVNERDANGETPFLLNATCYCNEVIAALLLGSGADINERTADGSGVFHIGLYGFTAAKDSQWFDFLVIHGADLEMEDGEGMTPFEFALQQENLELIDYLLSRGVDPDGGERKGMPPLMAAVLKDQHQVAGLLLKYHADPAVRCGAESPVDYVAKRGSASMKQVFASFLAAG